MTPPPPAERRTADARSLGKVLSVVFGLFVFGLCVLFVFFLYALDWVPIGPP
jgi:hypothetical protein